MLLLDEAEIIYEGSVLKLEGKLRYHTGEPAFFGEPSSPWKSKLSELLTKSWPEQPVATHNGMVEDGHVKWFEGPTPSYVDSMAKFYPEILKTLSKPSGSPDERSYWHLHEFTETFESKELCCTLGEVFDALAQCQASIGSFEKLTDRLDIEYMFATLAQEGSVPAAVINRTKEKYRKDNDALMKSQSREGTVWNRTPFFEKVANFGIERPERLERLVDDDQDLNTPDWEGTTPLHFCIKVTS